MPKLALVFDASYQTRDLMLSWEDGLRAALSKLGDDWEVHAYTTHGMADFTLGKVKIHQRPHRESVLTDTRRREFDLALAWGSIDRPLHGFIREVAPKTALCFAGGPTQHPFLRNFDLVFAETPYHLDAFKRQKTNARIAFGVNTDIFHANTWQKPHFLAVHPAAFADYKRYPLFAEAFKDRGLAVGQVQLRADGTVFEGETCHEVCLRNGVAIIPRMMPYYMMPYIYGLAEVCAITSTTYGGGDRAVLEAMACGKPVVICSDNVKLRMLLPEGYPVADPRPQAIRELAENLAARPNRLHTQRSPQRRYERTPERAHVMSKYSVDIYADQLREGLESLL